tara:strand:- start:159 stop:383 length:225 start_codon:yes stop_codon:yes gene_type:complete
MKKTLLTILAVAFLAGCSQSGGIYYGQKDDSFSVKNTAGLLLTVLVGGAFVSGGEGHDKCPERTETNGCRTIER